MSELLGPNTVANPLYTIEITGTVDVTKLGVGGSVTTSVVPEPSTWAMMMLGFAGLGYAAFRRNTKSRTAAVAI